MQKIVSKIRACYTLAEVYAMRKLGYEHIGWDFEHNKNLYATKKEIELTGLVERLLDEVDELKKK